MASIKKYFIYSRNEEDSNLLKKLHCDFELIKPTFKSTYSILLRRKTIEGNVYNLHEEHSIFIFLMLLCFRFSKNVKTIKPIYGLHPTYKNISIRALTYKFLKILIPYDEILYEGEISFGHHSFILKNINKTKITAINGLDCHLIEKLENNSSNTMVFISQNWQCHKDLEGFVTKDERELIASHIKRYLSQTKCEFYLPHPTENYPINFGTIIKNNSDEFFNSKKYLVGYSTLATVLLAAGKDLVWISKTENDFIDEQVSNFRESLVSLGMICSQGVCRLQKSQLEGFRKHFFGTCDNPYIVDYIQSA